MTPDVAPTLSQVRSSNLVDMEEDVLEEEADDEEEEVEEE